jgi:hypothetical protein
VAARIRTGWTRRTKRSSEREPADSLRDKSNVIGGWLPSLTLEFKIGGAIQLQRLALGVFLLPSANYPVAHELFPSGAWTGFYNYRPKDKHRMDLDLTFAAGIRHFHLNVTASSGMIAP